MKLLFSLLMIFVYLVTAESTRESGRILGGVAMGCMLLDSVIDSTRRGWWTK